ncbi:phage tail sheath family protein [Halalkalicoccus salilacus]|uniref:phage tail sheath family protein n=1 Tax=Halalkalicoccus salilacus TaxID=3117459 RepID=UPI00300E8DF8
MPEYLSPGVYMEEVESGAKPIAGVSTSTAGFLGRTERGPVTPQFITSFSGFERTFGGFELYQSGEALAGTYLAYAVDGFFRNGGSRCYVGRILANDAETATLTVDDKAKFDAVGPGAWGNAIAVSIENAARHDQNSELFRVTVEYWTVKTGEDPATVMDDRDADKEEVYNNLSPVETDTDYYENRINGVSDLVEVTRLDAGRPTNEGRTRLEDGNDGATVDRTAYAGEETPKTTTLPSGEERIEIERTGFVGFKAIDDISIVCAPDENSVAGLRDEVLNHCQHADLKDRFAILQAPQDFDLQTLPGPPGNLDSDYAAYYVPWVRVLDPMTNLGKLVPPGGHIAGIYARTDTERGVHKAPANEVVRGITELQFDITKGQQDVLNPKGVNCIRSFPGRGIRVWGARTTSSNALWRYVSVRRLFLYIEESIDEGTQWVVFEPNDEKLWARVRQSVSNFLTTTWRDGALMGTTPEEAFYVRCDRTTMTDDDIAQGKLIVEVGIAPVRPAEFVIFRVTQLTSSAENV